MPASRLGASVPIILRNYLPRSMMRETGITSAADARGYRRLGCRENLGSRPLSLHGLCWPHQARADCLAGDHLDALAVNRYGQNFTASLDDGSFYARTGIRLDQQDHATPAAGAADFSSQGAVPPRPVNDAVYPLGRNGRQVALAEGPFFPHQASGLVPVRLLHGEAHFLGNFRDSLEAILHGEFAADLRLEHFPIVDAVLA